MAKGQVSTEIPLAQAPAQEQFGYRWATPFQDDALLRHGFGMLRSRTQAKIDKARRTS